MTTQEALVAIRKRCALPDLSVWQLRYLIQKGLIPAPELSPSLAWRWSQKDIDAAVKVVNARKKRAKRSQSKAEAK